MASFLLNVVQFGLRTILELGARRASVDAALAALEASLRRLDDASLSSLDPDVVRHGIGRERHRARSLRIVLNRPYDRVLAPLATLSPLELAEEARRTRRETITLVRDLRAAPRTRVPALGGTVSAKAYAHLLTGVTSAYDPPKKAGPRREGRQASGRS